MHILKLIFLLFNFAWFEYQVSSTERFFISFPAHVEDLLLWILAFDSQTIFER